MALLSFFPQFETNLISRSNRAVIEFLLQLKSAKVHNMKVKLQESQTTSGPPSFS